MCHHEWTIMQMRLTSLIPSILSSIHASPHPCIYHPPTDGYTKVYQVFFKLHELIDFLRNPYKNSFLFLGGGC